MAAHNQLTGALLAACGKRMLRTDSGLAERALPPETEIVRQGEPFGSVAIVLAGSVRIGLGTPKGTDYLVAVEGPGEIVGEAEALTGDVATCTATTITACRIAEISLEGYRRWLEEDHEFSLLVNQVLCNRVLAVTRRAAIHLSYPLEYSVLKLLAAMAEERASLTLELSKREVADFLATNVRSVNRILRDLQDRRVLSVSGNIEILSMERLERAMQRHDE